MSRKTILILVAFGAAAAGFTFSTAAKRLQDEEPAAEASVAASPQTASVDWRETHGVPGEQLVFSVESLHVMPDGWRVSLALENRSSVAYELGDSQTTLNRSFGVMLFSTGELEELNELSSSGTLPAVRPAVRYEPSLPAILEPDASWQGIISAPGALSAGSWLRVVFGTLISVGNPPEELGENIVWITDSAYRLRS
ncbi:MAG: hypothetical protein H0U00_01655 [Actinobacteria bacterium]|nr:hypothetical protein [Actinomycetota bacterium]